MGQGWPGRAHAQWDCHKHGGTPGAETEGSSLQTAQFETQLSQTNSREVRVRAGSHGAARGTGGTAGAAHLVSRSMESQPVWHKPSAASGPAEALVHVA